MRQPNYWIIDGAIDPALTGTLHPAGAAADPSRLTLPFRLVDDEQEVVAHGRMLPEWEIHAVDLPAPLEKWGRSLLGAVAIQFPMEFYLELRIPAEPQCWFDYLTDILE